MMVLQESCFQYPVGNRQPALVPVLDCSATLEGEQEPLKLVCPSAPFNMLQHWVRHTLLFFFFTIVKISASCSKASIWPFFVQDIHRNISEVLQ